MTEHEFNGKKILCLDFDGVIHSYISGWKGDVRTMNDPIVPGAIEFLIEAVKDFDVQIYSSRSGNPLGIQAMYNYTYENAVRYYSQFKYDTIGECPPEQALAKGLMNKLSFPTHKPPAWVALDDRVLNFDGNWPSIETLKNFKPWYQK